MVSGSRLQEFKQHTAEDENLQEISRLILCGWPDFRQGTPYVEQELISTTGMNFTLKMD